MPRPSSRLALLALSLAVTLSASTARADETSSRSAKGSTFWDRMPTEKKVTAFSLFGLGIVSSALWVYWGLDGSSHESNADDYRLSHGSVASVCGSHNVGCPGYASEHLAAEKAKSYQVGYLAGWLALEAAGVVTLFVWPNREAATETTVGVGAGALTLKRTF